MFANRRRPARSAVVGIAAAGLSVLLAGTAVAGPKMVANNLGAMNGKITRFYNDPANAKAGHDGNCYWGQDNGDDYACTVDTSNDGRPLNIVFMGSTKTFPGIGRQTMMPTPKYTGQLPICLPRWYTDGTRYHADGTSQNTYYCGFWY